jgi:hypothetical protein
MGTFTFDLNKFREDSKNTLLNPGRYFSSVSLTGGFSEPIVKSVAYGILTGLVYLICWFFRIRSFGAGYIGEAVGLLAFLKIILGTALGSAIGALILSLLAVFCNGNSGFEANYHVTSSLLTFIPVYSVLSISWNIGFFPGLCVTTIAFVFFLWLLYYAMIKALKCKRKNVKIIVWGFLLVILLFVFLSLRENLKKGKPDEQISKPPREIKKK